MQAPIMLHHADLYVPGGRNVEWYEMAFTVVALAIVVIGAQPCRRIGDSGERGFGEKRCALALRSHAMRSQPHPSLYLSLSLSFAGSHERRHLQKRAENAIETHFANVI